MKDYRFSLGSTATPGEVGLCFTIKAEDETEALAKAQEFVDSTVDGVECDVDGADDTVFYVNCDLTVTTNHLADVQMEEIAKQVR